MPVRGIRGATTITEDVPEIIFAETEALIREITRRNPALKMEDVSSVIFSTTDDIRSAYPAKAVRGLGWDYVPLFCLQEMDVDGSMRFVIRVLIHWNTDIPQSSIRHVYLNNAVNLRPDLAHERKN